MTRDKIKKKKKSMGASGTGITITAGQSLRINTVLIWGEKNNKKKNIQHENVMGSFFRDGMGQEYFFGSGMGPD